MGGGRGREENKSERRWVGGGGSALGFVPPEFAFFLFNTPAQFSHTHTRRTPVRIRPPPSSLSLSLTSPKNQKRKKKHTRATPALPYLSLFQIQPIPPSLSLSLSQNSPASFLARTCFQVGNAFQAARSMPSAPSKSASVR